MSYYEGGNTGRIINEDGEMDIWDSHIYSSGRVLIVYDNQVLVFFHSKIDENLVLADKPILDELFVEWVPVRNLF